MNENKKRVWNIVLILLSMVGVLFFALQFAVAIELKAFGRVFLFFFLTSCCIETLFFSSRNLIREIRKRKKNSP